MREPTKIEKFGPSIDIYIYICACTHININSHYILILILTLRIKLPQILLPRSEAPNAGVLSSLLFYACSFSIFKAAFVSTSSLPR